MTSRKTTSHRRSTSRRSSGSTRSSSRRRSGNRQSIAETLLKSVVRSMGRRIGTILMRLILRR